MLKKCLKSALKAEKTRGQQISKELQELERNKGKLDREASSTAAKLGDAEAKLKEEKQSEDALQAI